MFIILNFIIIIIIILLLYSIKKFIWNDIFLKIKMTKKSINIIRCGPILNPDRTRVLIRPFIPRDPEKSLKIIARVMTLSEDDTLKLLNQIWNEFGERHQRINEILLRHYNYVKKHMITDQEISEERKLLIGAYFTQEYSLESAALFNPSIVLHPEQKDLPEGTIRFILSLRATGEGHISSITFRDGYIDSDNIIRILEPTRYVTEPDIIPNPLYEKELFEKKLDELDFDNEISNKIMASLDKTFTMKELIDSVNNILKHYSNSKRSQFNITAENVITLAKSNYEVTFHSNQRLSERAIFPTSPSQSNGIEDARFVRFKNDDDNYTYYATYTAFDGKLVLPQLIETPDFLHFKFITLNGPAAQNKGMALFPRKINNHYAMISRQDNENIYLMYSDNIHFWNYPEIIVKPTYPWEFVQLGNCGSPIEIDEGWLVLTHGVGPMRKYCIGAFLLEKSDPSKIIGRLKDPLLKPNENEREGYVPNVVYTCGAMVHNKILVLPYALSDYATSFALIKLDELINNLI